MTISDMAIVSDTATTDNNLMFNDSTIDRAFDWGDFQKEFLAFNFQKATLYKLTDTIIADFNGDGIMDKAFHKKENEISGIIIIHGQTNEEFRIGFGKPFAHMTEFNWIDYWALIEDKETNEITFSEDGSVLGTQKINLQNPSIFLGQNETGGGLITFMNGKYVWIHQTC